jgi:glutamine amidotransferase PdxT
MILKVIKGDDVTFALTHNTDTFIREPYIEEFAEGINISVSQDKNEFDINQKKI